MRAERCPPGWGAAKKTAESSNLFTQKTSAMEAKVQLEAQICLPGAGVELTLHSPTPTIQIQNFILPLAEDDTLWSKKS